MSLAAVCSRAMRAPLISKALRSTSLSRCNWVRVATPERNSAPISLGRAASRHNGCTASVACVRAFDNQPPRWSSTISAIASASQPSNRSVPAASP